MADEKFIGEIGDLKLIEEGDGIEEEIDWPEEFEDDEEEDAPEK